MNEATLRSSKADRLGTTKRRRVVAVAGNPNVGKTTVFNRLTGLRQKVGNYPGVTVEWKVGYLDGGRGDQLPIEILDVPGVYSLNPNSIDEEIAYRALIGDIEDTPAPDLIVCVVDASNLERNLYLVSQILDLGVPMIVALNMTDSARANGMQVNANTLARELGVPVIPMVASDGRGIAELRQAIRGTAPACPARRWELPPTIADEITRLAGILGAHAMKLTEGQRFNASLRAVTGEIAPFMIRKLPPEFRSEVENARARLQALDPSYTQAEIIGRYAWIGPIAERSIEPVPGAPTRTLSDRIDAILTHRIAGPIFFVLALALIFQAVFNWAVPVMDWIEEGTSAAGAVLSRTLPAGPLRDMLVDGVVAGVGAILVFLPQILILFLFLGLLEDTGYMARAAFLMDRLMNRVGLSGRSVVPLLSSFACAIPGIMATRTIDNQRDRLVTILVAPFMTCSARLPVYALLIGAFVPRGKWLGFWSYQGMTLFTLYLLGIFFAVLAGAILKKLVFKGERALFMMELPPYRRPRLSDLLWRLYERSRLFVTRAGTIILAISIVLWFLASYPKAPAGAATPPQTGAATGQLQVQVGAPDQAGVLDQAGLPVEAGRPDPAGLQGRGEVPDPPGLRDEARLQGQGEVRQAGRALEASAIGRAGRAIEPLIRPLGFNWKIGVALISSFAAREVAVSALATIYSVEDPGENSVDLKAALRADRYPGTGKPVFTPLVAASLMIFFVLAMQCMSTLAVAKRETNSWRWPLFMLGYMSLAAYLASLLVYQGGRFLGLG